MQRQKQIVTLAAILLLLLSGCASDSPAQSPSQPIEVSPPAQQIEAPELNEPQKDNPEPDYLAVFVPVLDETCDILYNGYGEEEEYQYASTGIIEMTMWDDSAILLHGVGYSIADISGDGIPELLIGMISGDSSNDDTGLILGGYALKDGEIVTFLEGWARNRYQWMGNGRFLSSGSSGAASSAFGIFRIAVDGMELLCEDFYYTAPLDEDYADIGYYHNSSGSWDSEDGEALNISDADFWYIMDGFEAQCLPLELTPFAEYNYSGYISQPIDCKIRLDYLDDVSWKYSSYEDASSYVEHTDYETMVLFQPSEDISNFKLLSLEFQDVDSSGHAIFGISEILEIPVLKADTPLAVPLSFPGDIPSSGFSYEDSDGTVKQYSISMSGKDGSLHVATVD